MPNQSRADRIDVSILPPENAPVSDVIALFGRAVEHVNQLLNVPLSSKQRWFGKYFGHLALCCPIRKYPIKYLVN